MEPWYASPYTGLFTRFGVLPLRPHDPSLPVWAGELPPIGPRPRELAVGGAGWNADQAEAACVGEAIERFQPYPLPGDQVVESSFDAWPLDEPAVDPQRWVLFHPEQYAQANFPFVPFTGRSVCPWVCFREALSGRPWWLPEELAYLFLRPGGRHQICPSVSTGLSCGRVGDPVLLRGLQEVIERDAVMGAWWGSYPLEEWSQERVLATLPSTVAERILRPNLCYRYYRVATPFSAHVTVVTVEGADREGFCFSAGSACRETRSAAWSKALLEAVHARHYVRYLLRHAAENHSPAVRQPTNFQEHGVYYSRWPEELERTVLHRAMPATEEAREERAETVRLLAERLGPQRPVLFRNMTPPGLAGEVNWYVLRVIVPGLQPLHGDHRLAHLGGALWAPRGLAAWSEVLPHPYP